MGVTGLWNLIDQAGRPVPLDTLENKVLAIDISIWLHQVVKGFQDSGGASLPNAHLLGLFNRLCKLLYYRIKPVFIFDGGAPALKRDTLRKRLASRRKITTESDRLKQRLLESISREKIVAKALGVPALPQLSPHKSRVALEKEEMFKLPPLASDADRSASSMDATQSESDSSFDEKTSRNYYNVNLQAIDVTSKHFQSLPADVRHEILTDIKETRKESSWGRLHELPAQSDEFSEFQMKRLLKRRQVQQSLETAETEMGGKSLSLMEIETLLAADGVVDGETATKKNIGSHMAFNEHTRFLHVRDMKRAIKEEQKQEQLELELQADDEEGKSPRPTAVGDDDDLQRAIKMSLEECCGSVDANEAGPSTGNRVKLRPEQKRLLVNTAKTIAKDYMVGYGGLNTDDIDELMELPADEDNENERTFRYNDTSVLHGVVADPAATVLGPSPPKKPRLSTDAVIAVSDEDDDAQLQLAIQMSLNDSAKTTKKDADQLSVEQVDDVSSNADSDFIDVPHHQNEESLPGANDHNSSYATIEQHLNAEPSIPDGTVDFTHSDLLLNVSADSQRKHLERCNVLEVIIKADGHQQPIDDDIFADIFENKIIATEKQQINAGSEKKESSKNTTIEIEMNDVEKSSIDSVAAGPAVDLNAILNGLNTEMDTVAKIKLDSILPPSMVNDEIIEITDEEPKNKITKQSSISSYITVVSTPKKVAAAERTESPPTTPKIKSPFFRNKSSSSKKKNTAANESQPDSSKVAKVLFDSNEVVPNLTATDVLDAAADTLRSIKSKEELSRMANVAQQEIEQLRFEQNKQSRIGANITDQMGTECKQLLRLFGVPYLVAPQEAEAQCAYLDAANLTDGTITDDSDIWLFGGRTVYKHFFNQAKNVQEYRADTVQQAFNIERSQFIQLAMLVGSDYTTGIHGIGAVTALEILAAFKSTAQTEGETTATQSLLSGLRKFKSWWQDGLKTTGTIGQLQKSLRKKLKNIQFTDDFPSHLVVDAYMNPEVERRQERFVWGSPDIESIREFTKQTFGWTRLRTDETLQPVLRRLEIKKSQISIKNYFSTIGSCSKEVTVSKRVRQAINKMGDVLGEEAEELVVKPKKAAAIRERMPRAKKESSESETKIAKGRKRKTNDGNVMDEGAVVASTSKQSTARVPNFCPPIKQRERSAEQMESNKQKAIELLAKSKSKNGTGAKKSK